MYYKEWLHIANTIDNETGNNYQLEDMRYNLKLDYHDYEPKAGAIVNAFASYRSNSFIRFYYKIKNLLNWRIKIKLYKGDEQ